MEITRNHKSSQKTRPRAPFISIYLLLPPEEFPPVGPASLSAFLASFSWSALASLPSNFQNHKQKFTNWVFFSELGFLNKKTKKRYKLNKKGWNLHLSRRCSGVKPSSLFLPPLPRAWALSRSFSLWLPRDQISN